MDREELEATIGCGLRPNVTDYDELTDTLSRTYVKAKILEGKKHIFVDVVEKISKGNYVWKWISVRRNPKWRSYSSRTPRYFDEMASNGLFFSNPKVAIGYVLDAIMQNRLKKPFEQDLKL